MNIFRRARCALIVCGKCIYFRFEKDFPGNESGISGHQKWPRKRRGAIPPTYIKCHRSAIDQESCYQSFKTAVGKRFVIMIKRVPRATKQVAPPSPHHQKWTLFLGSVITSLELIFQETVSFQRLTAQAPDTHFFVCVIANKIKRAYDMHGSSGIRPPSYEAVQREKFYQNLAQAVEGANRIIATSGQPRELAQALVNRLISQYQLSLPQLSSASSAIQNSGCQLDPDQLDWKAWEKRYYTINAAGLYFEKSDLAVLQLAISQEIGKKRMNDLKYKCSTSLGTLGFRGIINDCESYIGIAKLSRNQSKPVTPILRECIQHGFFSREFIFEVLFKGV